MTGQEARDDEREALAEVLARAYSASPYRDAHLRGADAILAAGYRKHPEPEWEYAVHHVSADGWPTFRIHADEQSAKADFSTCGMNCALVRRTPGARVDPGPWVPVGEGEQR